MSDLAAMIYLKEFCCFSIFSSGCNRPNPSTLLDHKYRKIIILYTNLEIKFFKEESRGGYRLHCYSNVF